MERKEILLFIGVAVTGFLCLVLISVDYLFLSENATAPINKSEYIQAKTSDTNSNLYFVEIENEKYRISHEMWQEIDNGLTYSFLKSGFVNYIYRIEGADINLQAFSLIIFTVSSLAFFMLVFLAILGARFSLPLLALLSFYFVNVLFKVFLFN